MLPGSRGGFDLAGLRAERYSLRSTTLFDPGPTEENAMRRYERVSGIFFLLLAILQLARVIRGWPVQVAGVSVPVWASVIACLITGSLAVWAYRASRGAV